MQPLPESIHFARPLRQIQLAPPAPASASAPALTPAAMQEQEIYERGRRDGERAFQEQLAHQRAEWAKLESGVLASLQAAMPAAIRDCEASLVSLALDIAQKLVSGLAVSAEMVEASIREALAEAEESGELHILVHPDDLGLLQQVKSPLLAGGNALQKIVLQPSNEVSRGGCIVKTRFGIIDARRETKLRMMEQLLQAA